MDIIGTRLFSPIAEVWSSRTEAYPLCGKAYTVVDNCSNRILNICIKRNDPIALSNLFKSKNS